MPSVAQSAALFLRFDELHVQLNLDNITKESSPEIESEVAAPDLARRLEPGVPATVDGESTTPPNSTANVTGRVTSPMVKSPSIDHSSPSPDTRVERNAIVGRFSTSSSSAERVCASRSGFPVSMEARAISALTLTSSAVPPTYSPAFTSPKRPRTLAIPRWRMVKLTAEWRGSSSQSPDASGSEAACVVVELS